VVGEGYLFVEVNDKIMLIGYAFIYNIGEILRTPVQNLSYIYMGRLTLI